MADAELPIDRGFSHVALPVADIDRSIDFYRRFAEMDVVHRRTGDDGVRVAWITDHTRPFVVVLLEHEPSHVLGGWSHLGIGVESRTVVDERLRAAAHDGLTTLGPLDHGPPTGYWGIIEDPDGHNLEISFGQEVAFTVDHAGRSNQHPTDATG